MSRLGLRLALLYLLWPLSWATAAASITDVKSNVAFLQIGLLPQMLLLSFPGGLSWASGLWWGWTYLILVPPLALLMYLLGAQLERRRHR
jgi:hypothetical protein